MSTRLTVRSLYAATEPLRVLRPAETIVGVVYRCEYLPEWMISHQAAREPAPKRTPDGRLRKRRHL